MKVSSISMKVGLLGLMVFSMSLGVGFNSYAENWNQNVSSEYVFPWEQDEYDATGHGVWKQEQDSTWRYIENGKYVTDWRYVDGKWYYMNETGIMTSNSWQRIHDSWFYFDETGAKISNSWVQGLYYVGADGGMWTDSWTPDGYYVGSDGSWKESYGRKDVKPELVEVAIRCNISYDEELLSSILKSEEQLKLDMNKEPIKLENDEVTNVSNNMSFLNDVQQGRCTAAPSVKKGESLNVKSNNNDVASLYGQSLSGSTRDTHTMDNSYMFNIKSN